MGWKEYQGPAAFDVGNAAAAAAVGQVTSVMATLAGQVNSFTATANNVMSQLGNIQIDAPAVMPELKIDRKQVDLEWDAPDLSSLALADIDDTIPVAPALTLPSLNFSPRDVVFRPSINGVHIPSAPAAIDLSGIPVRPVTGEVTLPAMRDFQLPERPTMIQLDLPTFKAPTLPSFDEVAPAFQGAAPSTAINWAEPTYMSENFDAVKATIKRIFAGGTGLPPLIEQQLFDRARAREDITAQKAVAEAFDTFASRGFDMPPGMLAAQVNAAREQGQLASNALQRELVLKVADVEIENMRFAVQQGLAAENIMTNLFMNAATRAFEVAKYSVEGAIQLYNVQAGVFNSVMNGYQIRSQVHKVNIDAKLAELDVYRTQIEAQKLIGEVNSQAVQAYNYQVQAVGVEADIFKSQVAATETQARVIASQIEAYRAEVGAYAEGIGAKKLAFDAYKVQVDGEVAKAGIMDSEARAFVAQMQAEEIRANTYYKGVDAQVELFRANNQQYAVALDAAKAVIQAQVSKVEAAARVEGLKIQYKSVTSDANRAKAEAEIRLAEQQLQGNIAATNAAIELYKASTTKAVQEAELKSRALQAAGQMASTLAGGAMAAQHVQASVSAGQQANTTHGVSFSQSATENWAHEGS